MPTLQDSAFDAALVDQQDQPIALVQIKSLHLGDAAIEEAVKRPHPFSTDVDYLFWIDPMDIRLYRWSGAALGEPVVCLNTAEILRHYDPEFGKQRVFKGYLQTLVEAWLRDLAYRWKSETPPGAEALRSAGLLDRVEGGTTHPLGG